METNIKLTITSPNKKVGKPYNAADARHVDFPKFRGRGAPMVVDIAIVR